MVNLRFYLEHVLRFITFYWIKDLSNPLYFLCSSRSRQVCIVSLRLYALSWVGLRLVTFNWIKYLSKLFSSLPPTYISSSSASPSRFAYWFLPIHMLLHICFKLYQCILIFKLCFSLFSTSRWLKALISNIVWWYLLMKFFKASSSPYLISNNLVIFNVIATLNCSQILYKAVEGSTTSSWYLIYHSCGGPSKVKGNA